MGVPPSRDAAAAADEAAAVVVGGGGEQRQRVKDVSWWVELQALLKLVGPLQVQMGKAVCKLDPWLESATPVSKFEW